MTLLQHLWPQHRKRRVHPSMMTVFGPPPPPPPDYLQMMLERVVAELRVMDDEMEKLREEVKELETERQWWRRWHIKWGGFFRAWRDGTPPPPAPVRDGTPPPPPAR